MPLYEYQCLACGEKSELLQRYADPPLAACPKCGGEVKKLLSSPAFQFKGSGFYATDYAGKKGGDSKSDGKGDGAKADSSAGSPSDSKSDPKSDSKADAKPAAAKPKETAAATGKGAGGD
jgi:putative FmdB family regulatory protein